MLLFFLDIWYCCCALPKYII